MDTSDTIAAIATPSGPALRGMVRISGPEALRIGIAGFETAEPWPRPGRAEVRAGRLRIRGLRAAIPASVALWPGPRTYAGEDLAEIETVGAVPVLQTVLSDRLAAGARLAEPGEFTLRAFLSGRIDLTQAEAVLGVIEADDPGRLDAALKQLAGGLATPIDALRNRLLDVLAHIEAGLDFVDEADVDPIARRVLSGELAEGAATLRLLSEQLESRERPGGKPKVVLVGPPNAGKSRLFNALVGSGRAIVSPVAGTTRDYLSADTDCKGIAVELIDTAGIEPPTGPIPGAAQAFRDQQATEADLLLDCAEIDSEAGPIAGDPRRIRVWTKADRAVRDRLGGVVTSAIDGTGLDPLRSAIASALRSRRSIGEGVGSTGSRCRAGLDRAASAIDRASGAILAGRGEEFAAIDLRTAVEELGRVVGAEVGDEVLDRIFRRFCIGK